MVALNSAVIKWSNPCYEQCAEEQSQALGLANSLTLWRKLWPGKHTEKPAQKVPALDNDIGTYGVQDSPIQRSSSRDQNNKLARLADECSVRHHQQQQQQQQQQYADLDRRWWAIGTSEGVSGIAAAAADHSSSSSLVSSSQHNPSCNCSNSNQNCTCSSSSSSSSSSGCFQQYSSTLGRLHSLQDDITPEEDYVNPAESYTCQNPNLSTWHCGLGITTGSVTNCNTYSCNRDQLTLKQHVHHGADASRAYRKVHIAASSSSSSSPNSTSSRRKDCRHQLAQTPMYNEQDLLKLKQLDDVELQVETLTACVDHLSRLIHDCSRARVLGRGSYGTVYQIVAPWPSAAVAAQVSAAFPDGRFAHGMPLVVEVVEYSPADLAWSQEMCIREEVNCTAANGSPWAPQLLWAQHDTDRSWFVFEAFVPDPITLDDYLRAQPDLPTETIFHIVDQLGRALDDLHSNRGLVHNDLKPAQVCLPRRVLSAPCTGTALLPNFYLVDYGISSTPGTAVADHGFGGTLIYMDPQLKHETLVRVGSVEDQQSGQLAMQYKVTARPGSAYQATHDYYALGQVLALILARGNESLHQKVVCLAAAAFAAGNRPELYEGVRALLCDHPGATKGLLGVVTALIGPQHCRPSNYRQLQQILARSRVDCRPEPNAAGAWQHVSNLFTAIGFRMYDDEVLVGQMTEDDVESNITRCISAAAAAASHQQQQMKQNQLQSTSDRKAYRRALQQLLTLKQRHQQDQQLQQQQYLKIDMLKCKSYKMHYRRALQPLTMLKQQQQQQQQKQQQQLMKEHLLKGKTDQTQGRRALASLTKLKKQQQQQQQQQRKQEQQQQQQYKEALQPLTQLQHNQQQQPPVDRQHVKAAMVAAAKSAEAQVKEMEPAAAAVQPQIRSKVKSL